jgi:hypothetical protein
MATPADIFPFGQPAGFGELQRQFHGQFDFRETTVSTGVGATRLVAPDAERISLTMASLGPNAVNVGPRGTVSTLIGIQIAGNGGFINFSLFEDYILPTLEWFGVAPAGVTTVYILEVYRFKHDVAPTP